MSERKMRVWLTSVGTGVTTAIILVGATVKMGTAYWFPPFWPGMLFRLICQVLSHGQQWNGFLDLVPAIAGNSVFYAWVSFRVLRAEILARGRLSRYFLT